MGENIRYHKMTCETAANRLKRKIPYGWDLNIYRGCEHGCKYCYAMYSHHYINSENFFEDIYIKTNIVDALERQLRLSSWKREIVNIGGVTDSYQPAEAAYKIMPEILRLLIKYRTPTIISTKSNLILRDFDLVDELSRITYINVAATITTTDEQVRSLIEPNSASSKDRFDMLKEFRKTNASVGLHVMPIIPYLTDSYENIDELFLSAKESNVHYVLPGVLYLRGQTRKTFFDFILDSFPELYERLSALYKTGAADKTYKDKLYQMVNPLRDKYSLSKSYMQPIKEKINPSDETQLTLFMD
ncbi:MAG: Radical domain protein [Clostridia bacterium]|jgi:DNA repair photolyase|nr:Radical domain protein [Clostridia bacterium]